MKKFIIILIVYAFIGGRTCWADNIEIDTTNWSQEEINMIQSMTVKILADNSITYKGIGVKENVIILDGPSADVSKLLTADTINQEYEHWKADSDAAQQKADTEAAAKKAELADNTVAKLDFDKIDAELAKADDFNSLKSLVAELLKYIKARE